MLRDVFYYGDKPNVHPREQFAENLADARFKSTTHDFWIINEFCDYQNFDWDFDFELLPDEDVWAEDHNNVWPSQHQKDSGTWLCPKEYSDIIIYRGDVDPVKRKNERTSNWILLDNIDDSKFDFSWHPDPTAPAYIYKWGCKFFPAELKHVLEYHVEGATTEKYMNVIAELLPNSDCWTEHDLINKTKFDMSWRPNPMDPPFIYVWGNKWVDGKLKPTLTYHAPNAVDTKYMPEHVPVLPEWDKWVEIQAVDKNKFDFTWRPDPREPSYIYTWGNKHIAAQDRPTLEYHCDDATDRKYMDEQVPVLPEWDRWKIVQKIDMNSVDFTWRPDPKEPPFTYVFGNELYDAVKMPTIIYNMPDGPEVKYMGNLKAKLAPNVEKFRVLIPIDNDSFDFAWLPDPDEPPYIYTWGNQWNSAEIEPTVEFHVEGATQRKFMDARATVLPDMSRWLEIQEVDKSKFDFSWRPDPTSPPYIYTWGNKWIDAELRPTLEYHCEGAVEPKYMSNDVPVTPESDRWKILQKILPDSFDFTWRPDPREPPYTYVFGNELYDAIKMPTIMYNMPDGPETKYVHDITAKLAGNRSLYEHLEDAELEDYSWVPDPDSPPYIYAWGNQWNKPEDKISIQISVPGATEYKYMEQRAIRKPNRTNWEIPDSLSAFDFSWEPNPNDPPYIYEFATVWNNRGGPRYVVPGATEYKYVEDIKAVLKPDRTNWEIQEGVDTSGFDFSWVPHPDAPAYVYQFGTKTDNDDGPRYVTPNNSGEVVYLERIESTVIVVGQYPIETTLDDLVAQHPNEIFWATRKNIDYSSFDFDWRPGIVEVAWELDYVHVFGSPDSELTQTYFISAKHYAEGNTSLKFVEELKLDESTLSKIFAKPDMFFVDRSNPESAARFEALRAKFGTRIQKTRYLNSWVDTISRCNNRATTELLWVFNSELDYTDFNFDYYPNPWQMKMVHVFGTQWSHWGTTFMVNRETFKEDTKYIKVIEHLSNLNFVKNIKANATQCIHDIIVIDHGNTELPSVLKTVNSKACGRNVTTISYNTSYFGTLKEILKRQQEKKEHYIWICSSVCDYSDFDFSYICDPYAKDQLHVFPSGIQKFGDTFFVDVNLARELIDEMEKLEDFRKVNFNPTIKAKRLPEPVIVTTADTHVASIKNVTGFPYATIITEDNVDIEDTVIEPMNLWFPESKNILITSTGGTRIVVPIEAKDYVTSELYEYPYIKRMPKLVKSNPLDIVFLSNGETGAEENYEHLLKVTANLSNRVVRVDGVNGRVAAYHAAAEASNTPWFFTVFAKLEVSPKFDWNWQPDRMQIPKHYIFHAKNPVNGLIYGHQAMIAYNKKLTLGNEGKGLDFTLDNHHEVVPLISGTARYNTDSFSAWRTAFREAIKLKMGNDDDSRERLEAWLTKGEGEFAEYSIKGAQDAMTYYDEVNGDFDKLKLSYEWIWLKEKFDQI
jgi:hypothetical protein